MSSLFLRKGDGTVVDKKLLGSLFNLLIFIDLVLLFVSGFFMLFLNNYELYDSLVKPIVLIAILSIFVWAWSE